MTPAAAAFVTSNDPTTEMIQQQLDNTIESVLNRLPDPEGLSPEQRRGIIARYSAVLEGNFIYWMTGAYLAVSSEAARAKISDNLREEIRDCHPGMMRRFAIAADAAPSTADAQAVYRNLASVRQFIGRLAPVPTVVTMAFFEGFIQRFMPYLADLASRQGSTEMEYTDVHGVCDVTHTEELYRALDTELALSPRLSREEMFEGVALLRALIENIVCEN
jgi:hypothetical protein